MAFIRLKNGTGKFVSAEKGAEIWRVMNKEIRGTTAQRAFVKRIQGLYLNRDNAPASYVAAHPAKTLERRTPEPVTNIRMPYVD